MLLWSLVLILSLVIVGYFCIKLANYYRTVISLIPLIACCILIGAGWVACQNHLFDATVGSASVVAYNEDIAVNNSIYYDEAQDEYFFLDMGLWDWGYRRVVLDYEQAERYVQLSNQMVELPLSAMIK